MSLLDVLKITCGMVKIVRSTFDGAETILGPICAEEIVVQAVADVWEEEVERIVPMIWGIRKDVPCVKIVLMGTKRTGIQSALNKLEGGNKDA